MVNLNVCGVAEFLVLYVQVWEQGLSMTTDNYLHVVAWQGITCFDLDLLFLPFFLYSSISDSFLFPRFAQCTHI